MKLLHRTNHEVADVLEREQIETLPPLPEGVTVPDDARALDMRQEPRRRRFRRLLPWAGVAAIVAAGGVLLVDALRDEGTELEMRATSSLLIQESIDEALATARASVTDVADFARANELTGLSPASMVPAVTDVADFARANGLTGLSPASMVPAVTDVADFARANELTGLSPASMVPIES